MGRLGPGLASLALALCALSWPVEEALALDVPALSGRVNDRAELLSEDAKRQLEQQLARYEEETGHQFALLTIPSLEGDPIEDFSIRVVEEWKLGREGHDDGLLMLIVPEDRAMRIEVGYGLEGDIPDIIAGRVTRNVLAPHFRKLDFDGGVSQAFELLMKAGRGEEPALPARSQQPERTTRYERRGGSAGRGLLFMIIAMFFIFPYLGGGRRRRRGFFIGGLGGYGGGFGGGFGGGGGGFGGGGFSGGGGGFGGGGASGSW